MFENYSACKVDVLLGKTLINIQMSQSINIDRDDDYLVFYTSDGERYIMHHFQDCCEDVYIEDINGDLDDLLGSPILQAEQVVSQDETPDGVKQPSSQESYTWTFYKFATIHGYVTIRWFGSSNGYYSESVNFGKL